MSQRIVKGQQEALFKEIVRLDWKQPFSGTFLFYPIYLEFWKQGKGLLLTVLTSYNIHFF